MERRQLVGHIRQLGHMMGRMQRLGHTGMVENIVERTWTLVHRLLGLAYIREHMLELVPYHILVRTLVVQRLLVRHILERKLELGRHHILEHMEQLLELGAG
jgi:methyl coenzyme M reductase alpha subunit